MNIAKQTYTRLWRGALVIASLALLAYIFYFHRLGTLLPGYAQAEIHAKAASADWHLIVKTPIDAPYKVLVWLGTAIMHQGMLVTRIVSACFGIIAVLLFYLIARFRYTFWIASLATVLFATSAGFLHAARLGTGVVLQLGILAFMWCVLWYRTRPDHRIFIGYVITLVCALLLYVPGMIWFELLGFLLLHRNIMRELRTQRPLHLVLWAFIFLALVAPLVWAIVQDPHVARMIAGLPSHMHDLTHAPRSLLDTLLAIGIRSNGSPLLWVGHAPLLNVIEMALLFIGVYACALRIREAASPRAIFVLGATILATILASLGATITTVYLVPLLYILIASGLNYLIRQWLRVFPRNPIARTTGIALVCVMVSFSVLYQVRAYFVAWPHNNATRQTFKYLPKE